MERVLVQHNLLWRRSRRMGEGDRCHVGEALIVEAAQRRDTRRARYQHPIHKQGRRGHNGFGCAQPAQVERGQRAHPHTHEIKPGGVIKPWVCKQILKEACVQVEQGREAQNIAGGFGHRQAVRALNAEEVAVCLIKGSGERLHHLRQEGVRAGRLKDGWEEREHTVSLSHPAPPEVPRRRCVTGRARRLVT